MTISTTTSSITYTGNGSTTVFAYNFKILADSELQIYVDGTLKTLTTHYTVSGAGDASGGNVTFTSGNTPPDTKKVLINRKVARTQLTDYVENDSFPASSHENALDKLTMITQELDSTLSGKLFGFADSVSDAGTVLLTADASTRASKVLSFDASGGLVASQELGEFQGNWAASTAYSVRDLIKDTSNNNIYLCNTAHTSSGAQPISSNTDVAKWDLIVDAASATTSATNAASSATASASSATSAASSASSASTSASNASTSASTASTQATNSASSATSSASSATSASTSATSSSNYATKVDGAVTGTDYSSKAWAVGGTGVTDTASRGAAKEWATAAEDDQVDGSEYSAKHYATKASASATSAASSAAGMEAATIKDGTYWGYTTAGSANTYTLTSSPTISSYAADMFYHIKVNASNTGASTINVDSVGAKNIKKYGGAGMVDLAANDLESGGVYTIIYDGTQFLLLGGSATDSQVDINTADIFMLNSRRLSDHSANVLNTVDGFVDDFQDGSTQNNTAINISGSSNIAHDNTSKYWQNTRGSAAQTTDTAYTTESNYTQQEWTTAIVGSSNATFTNSSATVTISSGTWPANCANGRISQDGTNWYDIASRDSTTQLTLTSNFSQSTVTGTYTIRMSEFSGGKVQLNQRSASTGHSVTADNITVDTSTKKFGAAALKFDGSHDVEITDALTDFNIGTQDFCFEGWVYWPSDPTAHVSDKWFFHHSIGGVNAVHMVNLGYSHNNKIQFRIYQNNVNTMSIDASPTLTTGAWTHFAGVRDSTSARLYYNGTRIAENTTSAQYGVDVAYDCDRLRIGSAFGSGIESRMMNDSLLDDLRISIGTNRGYTGASITVPSSAHTTDAYTKLLLDCNASPIADSSNSVTVQYNVITEPVTTVPTFATLKDSSAWADMNSVAITDTPYNSSKTMTAVGDAKIKTSDSVIGSTDLTTLSSEGGSIASSDITINSGGSDKDYAFNDNHSEYASTGQFGVDDGGSAAWIGIELGSAKTLGKIKIHASSQSPTRIKNWKLYGDNSSTGVSGTVVATGTYADTKTLQEFTFTPNTTPYTHWTLEVLDNYSSGSNHVLIGEVELYEGTSVSPKIGTGMAKFDGSGDYLTTPDHADYDLGTGDFTFESWITWTGNTGSQNCIFSTDIFSNPADYRFFIGTDSKLKFGDGNGNNAISSASITQNTWVHVAAVRSSGTVTLYINGSADGTSSSVNSTLENTGGGAMSVGCRMGDGTSPFHGYIDEFRFSKTARYTGTFTPSTSAFTTDSDTKLLLHMDGSDDSTTFTDSHYDTYHYYSVIHMPTGVSAYNDTNVKVVVWTGTVWKEVARYYSSAWQRNTNTADSTATTWTNATVNDMVHCISEAIENNTRLRMKEADVEGISDANWEAAGGLTIGTTVKVGMAVTMKSASTSGNATTDLVQFNYDGANLQGTWKTRVFGGTNMPPLAGSAPSNIVLEVIDNRVSGTPSYKVSRDGGSNYDTISSWDIEDTLADGTTVRLADVTMAAASGTSPLVSIEQSGTGQDYRLYSLGLKYK